MMVSMLLLTCMAIIGLNISRVIILYKMGVDYVNVCIFYYDGFCEFEVVLLGLIFREKNVFTAALENKVYISEEKQKFLPDKTVGELNPDEIDLFVVPGGNPSYLFDNTVLRDFITTLNSKNKHIGAICGGPSLLASYGILDNKRCTGDSSGIREDEDYIELFQKAHVLNEDVVIDGNIITSTGQAFVEFAVELGKLMNIYTSDEEAQNDYRWIKNIKD